MYKLITSLVSCYVSQEEKKRHYKIESLAEEVKKSSSSGENQ